MECYQTIAIAESVNELCETDNLLDVLGYIHYKKYSWAIGRMSGSTPKLLEVLKSLPIVDEHGKSYFSRDLPEKESLEELIKHKLDHNEFGSVMGKCDRNMFVFEWIPIVGYRPNQRNYITGNET